MSNSALFALVDKQDVGSLRHFVAASRGALLFVRAVVMGEEVRPADGHSLTAEGMKAPNPTRGEFFSNLEKASRPDN